MDTNTLTPTVAAATLASIATSKRMAAIKVWGSMMRGARKYGGEHGFLTIHSMPPIVRVTGACENKNADLVNHDNVI